MASKAQASLAFFLALNLLCFSMTSATTTTITCPSDIYLNLKLCVNVLGLITIPPNAQCCGILGTLADAEAAACVCAAIKANVLGIPLNLTLNLTLNLLLKGCGKTLPVNYVCPAY
ncbi:putative lipid-binding protein AIR1B [Mercurialis annua]|uniref:putative lipid-binding protein AIR1B n=1 Tax=Mercurialis annua TaxID=3986 RepID=UPI00215FB675|nr:putative lipid-binding protein AIR1B [Mercurialis annua]